MAKLRRSAGEGVAKTQIRPCSKHASTSPRAQAESPARCAGVVLARRARRDWIHWLTSTKQRQTRARRTKNARSMLGIDAFAAPTALRSLLKGWTAMGPELT